MKVRRSREWWQRVVDEQAASRLSITEFAARHGLVEPTLRWWASEFRRPRAAMPPGRGFVEVVAAPARAAAEAGASGRSVPEPPEPAFAIRVGSGVTVLSSTLPPAEYVARLAAAYDGCGA